MHALVSLLRLPSPYSSAILASAGLALNRPLPSAAPLIGNNTVGFPVSFEAAQHRGDCRQRILMFGEHRGSCPLDQIAYFSGAYWSPSFH